jgi:hypothetical protein
MRKLRSAFFRWRTNCIVEGSITDQKGPGSEHRIVEGNDWTDELNDEANKTLKKWSQR